MEAAGAQICTFLTETGEELRPHEQSTHPTVSNLQSKVQNPNFESSTQGAKFEAVKSELQWRLYHAQVESQDHVDNFAEFRSQVSLLASERHRAQEQAVLFVSEVREGDQGHQQEVTLMIQDLEQTMIQMQNSSQHISHASRAPCARKRNFPRR